MKATFFETEFEFRNWLQKNHAHEKELIVGYYKVSTKKPSMTWSQSVDQALCFGWIDGIRKSIDEESYCIRFTPRKPKSIWSTININKVEQLIQQGFMTAAGLKAYAYRTENNSSIYSHENKNVALSQAYELKFMANKNAWTFFKTQTPTYIRTITHWIMSAKQEKTQIARLEKVMEASEQLKKL